MCKERIEMSLGLEMKYDLEVRMVNMRKDVQEQPIDELDLRGKVLREIASALGGEDGLVVNESLDPGHDQINVVWCGEPKLFAILVDP